MSEQTPHFELDRHAIRAHFERAAGTYDGAAVLQAEVARRLLERLDIVKLSPCRVLDLGAGTGLATADLLVRYPKATVIALDLALGMLRQAGRRGRWRRRASLVAADAVAMPFSNAAFDLICSSLMLQWCQPPDAVLRELARVVAPEGLVMFATLGPDTLRELRDSWARVDDRQHVGMFVDMHDIGDAMLRAGFKDPVVDVETITLTYESVPGLLRDLKALGATNAASGRASGLGGRGALAGMIRAYETHRREDGLLPATYEVIYGHAWAGEVRSSRASFPGETHIPVSQLLGRSRR
ncbi:malonyl-[acyl-carrier protein] O-methyltransferase BioC [Acidihalobacter yilgarnensis]|uniref:Malonyl-[acyl-carrier protein] O-methyltransferase n=1 Tax=Acidihalobacter yilgarnensis TaxID=2819280 RepID=A0A1D8IJX7_9GAMM|nr:malonyl-ACP O-methyltransferase BioC [Acidihalobacter yilgarnensis]AOU96777.1 malonyl-[acyl-carrier protein] O-methyltransferase BioC [Acidihalobacter yilgarnensis]